MPAKKQTSPEAEQKKLWQLEARDLTRARAKVAREFKAEFRRSLATSDAAAKASRAAHNRHLKLAARLFKSEARAIADIDRRLGILNGRIHS